MSRDVCLKTSLSGNFRLLVVEERFDVQTGEPYLCDGAGREFRLPASNSSPAVPGGEPE